MPIFLPLAIEPGKPILRGWDFLWSKVREAGRNGRLFTVSELDLAGNDPHRRNANDFVRRLVAGGYAEEAGWQEPGQTARGHKRTSPARLYRLVRRPKETPHLRRDGSAVTGNGRCQAMWNAIRALRTFTARELAITASTEERPVKPLHADRYTAVLAKAGYLAVAAPHRKGRGARQTTWRLKPSMNTGPKAPMLLKATVVYDQNRAAIAAPVVAEEAAS